MSSDLEARVRALLKHLRLSDALDALGDFLPRDPTERVQVLTSLEALLRHEDARRTERRIARRIQQSRLPNHPTLEAFDFDFQPGLSKDLILDLARLAWVDRKEDLVFIGQSGTGKSHIAKAMCLLGCKQGRRVLYTTCADMLARLFAAMADNSLSQVLRIYTRPSLLLIDDLGYDPIEQEQARESQLLYKVLEARHETASTIVTSNLEAEHWAKYLGDHYLTVALLDRLLYHGTVISIQGPSYRLAKHKERQEALGVSTD